MRPWGGLSSCNLIPWLFPFERLAVRAHMRAALTYRQFYDLGSTHKTGRAFAVVHAKIILKLTAAIDPIDAGAVAADAFLQHGLDRFIQRLCLFQRYSLGRPERMQLRHSAGTHRRRCCRPRRGRSGRAAAVSTGGCVFAGFRTTTAA